MRKIVPCAAICACAMFAAPLCLNAGETVPHRIGVATIFADAGWQNQVRYFDELIGPALNMEFVYSDKLSSSTELSDFMTKAISLGCDGVINFVTQNESVEVGAKLAEEKGIWYVTQNSMINEDVEELSHNLGHVGASVSGMEAAYNELLTEMIREDGRKGFFIYTGSAVGGDRGEGASSHFHSVKGMLEAIAKAYDLKYDSPVEELIDRKESGSVETGREDVSIYLSSSGSVLEGMVEAREQLGTGKYDTLLAVTSYTSFTNIVSEAEKKTESNIMIVATVSDDDMTTAGFEKTDQFGDSILHAAVINPLSLADARCSLLLSEAMEDAFEKTEDYVMQHKIEPWVCYDAADYKEIEEKLTEELENLLVDR